MADRLNLPLRYRNELEELFRAIVPDVEVWACGSRVNSMSHRGSDLDLVLRSATLEPLGTEHIDLIDALEQSNIPIQVQAHDWARLPKTFREEIQQDYVVLQNKRWQTAGLAAVVDLRLSSVDKKTKDNERPVLLCNYTDVYKNSFIHSDMNYMSATATDREISKCSLYAGDVIITKDSEKYDDIGVPALVREDVPNLVCGYHLAILRPLESVLDGTYLFYALNSHSVQHQFHAFANGITRFGLRKADIGLVRIPLPPLSEQREIARVLRQLDDRIELNRRMNVTLEEMVVALFRSWFVNFNPVRAKMQGRWQPGESLPGLPAHLYDLFPDRFVSSTLGMIPQGWTVRGLGEISHKPQYGYTASAKTTEVGPKFLRITDINKKAWIEWESVPYCEATQEQLEKYRLYEGDILIARMADPGHGCMIEENRRAVFASYLIRFRPLHKRYGRMLQYWLRSDAFWALVKGRGIGTTRVSLNAKVLSEFPLIVPSDAVMDQFRRQVSDLRARITANVEESYSLRVLRNEILPELVSGDVRVPHP